VNNKHNWSNRLTISLDGQVAIVTGAGRGLGRAHALALAGRGANVVVNELKTGDAEPVAEEIISAGGAAIAFGADVADLEQVSDMVAQTMDRWGRVDILINNAGLLRDKTFAKMSMDDFRLVVDVHLMGSANCTKAVWDIMRQQNYGRIVFTGAPATVTARSCWRLWRSGNAAAAPVSARTRTTATRSATATDTTTAMVPAMGVATATE
jgi:NAD(P)-dependent dehydrogenase (short-subunit alcohol dehydrogenase family)